MMAAVQERTFRHLRNVKLRGALSTSLIARIAGLVLQGISLPLAANSMGVGGFSTFAMLVAVTSWLMMASFGIARSVTVRVSYQLGQEDIEKAGYFCRSARAWISWLSGIVFLIVISFAVFTPAFDILFSNHAKSRDLIVYGIILISIVFVIQINLIVIEATQLGYQKQKAFGIFSAIGTLLSAAAIYIASVSQTDPLTFLVCLNGPALAFRFVNAVFFLRAHPECRIRSIAVRRGLTKELTLSSAPYFFGGSFNHFFCHIFPILIIGAFAQSGYLANITAVFYALILASSVFNFVLTPLLGSVPEAYSRGDIAWVRGAYLVALTVNIAFASVVGVTFAFFGEYVFQIWYQGAVSPSSLMLKTAGLYLILIALEATNFIFLAAIGHARTASVWLSVKAALTAVALVIFSISESWGLQYLPFALLLAANIAFSAAPMTVWVLQLFRPNAASG